MNNDMYLTDMPPLFEEHGICKTLAVRREVIHIKHIFTELFVRKTVDLSSMLEVIGMNLFTYMEFMANRMRRVHKFSRDYRKDCNEIVKSDRDRFFPTIDLLSGLDVAIVLDFDGVVTKNSFVPLYELCVQRAPVYVCSANPMVSNDFFDKRKLARPKKIYARKGKIPKIIQLIELQKRHDYVFYVDNQEEYLKYAWIFGIQTYHFTHNKIKFFGLNTK